MTEKECIYEQCSNAADPMAVDLYSQMPPPVPGRVRVSREGPLEFPRPRIQAESRMCRTCRVKRDEYSNRAKAAYEQSDTVAAWKKDLEILRETAEKEPWGEAALEGYRDIVGRMIEAA